MATLALAAAGAAAGSALLPAGVSVLGATISGAALGSQIGAFAGSYIDKSLFGPSGQTRVMEGPRLTDLHVTASTEGSPPTTTLRTWSKTCARSGNFGNLKGDDCRR